MRVIDTSEDISFVDRETITDDDRAIAAYILNNTMKSDVSNIEDYGDVIADDMSFAVRYNLSDYRSSIIRWYPFKAGASVLEIEAGYGALTGALCDSCQDVCVTERIRFKANMLATRYKNRKNLNVYIGDVQDIIFNRKFDYIICAEEFEYVKEEEHKIYIEYLYSLLEEDGIILFGIDNTYSINNLIGKRQKHSGIPFDSLADYPNKNLGRGYNKAEIKQILNDVGVKKYKFYYPMPDYIAPRALFTDDMMPQEDALGRLMVYHKDIDTLVASDRKIYEDAILNGVYDFLANTFWIEVSFSDKLQTENIKSVYLSGNKSRDKAFATILYQNDGSLKVQKKCLYDEGKAHVQKIFSIMQDLQNKNIDVLNMFCEDDSLYMDYVEMDTIQQRLIDLVSSGASKSDIYLIFDKLWDVILQSSEHSDEMADELREETVDMGIILSKAYIDMIITNSFWNGGKIMFFDQEYVRNDYPALYVLYRSIYLSYIMVKGLESVIAKDEFYSRYGITPSHITVFKKLEGLFAKAENPNYVFCGESISDEIMKSNRMKFLRDNARF